MTEASRLATPAEATAQRRQPPELLTASTGLTLRGSGDTATAAPESAGAWRHGELGCASAAAALDMRLLRRQLGRCRPAPRRWFPDRGAQTWRASTRAPSSLLASQGAGQRDGKTELKRVLLCAWVQLMQSWSGHKPAAPAREHAGQPRHRHGAREWRARSSHLEPLIWGPPGRRAAGRGRSAGLSALQQQSARVCRPAGSDGATARSHDVLWALRRWHP